MERQIKKLERTLAGWYKDAPHLSKSGQEWLGENVWWIVLIGAVLGAMGVLYVLFGVLFAGTFLTIVGGAVGAVLSGILFTATLVSLVFSIVAVVLSALSVRPLKESQKKGWNYLFVAYLVGVIAVFVDFVFHLGVNGFVGLLWQAVWLVVCGYFLFEVRSYLLSADRPRNKPTNS